MMSILDEEWNGELNLNPSEEVPEKIHRVSQRKISSMKKEMEESS
jgi:hypothetical protein